MGVTMAGKRFDKVTDDFESVGLNFRMNELGNVVEYQLDDDEWYVLDDFGEARIRTELRELGYGIQGKKKANLGAVRDAWLTLAYENRYNPIEEYFNQLRNDPKYHYSPLQEGDTYHAYRIKEFVHSYFDNPDEAFGIWLSRWMVGSIAKALRQERNPLLVIGGAQDKGKSTFVRWLCPLDDYHREGAIRPDSKDERLRLADTFIQEVPELGNTTHRTHAEAFKDHVTRKFIVERPPYGGRPVKMPAVCSFMATVNPDGAGFLVDTTGNTRFLVCEVNYIDFAYAKTDVNDLWAEAVWLYDNVFRSWELLPSEKVKRDRINKEYQLINPIDELIDEHLVVTNDADDFMTSAQIRDVISLHYRITSEYGFYRDLARILTARGLKKGRKSYSEGQPHRKGWHGIKKQPSVTLE